MKNCLYLFLAIIMVSCTSNTIFKEPKDLIPKDTMSLLLEEMMLASSAKFLINKNLEKNINYMPLVYKKFGIDSTRFQNSNLYYMSRIDDYEKLVFTAQQSIEKKKEFYTKLKNRLDSIKKDSLKKTQQPKNKFEISDSIFNKPKTTNPKKN